MARKKKESATDPQKWEDVPEIPKEEQPYPLPDEWKWVYLYSIATIKRGASPRPIKLFITFECNGVNWIKIGDGERGKFIESTKDKITQEGAKKSVFVDKGTLLLSNSMSFGQPYILNISGCIHDGWLAIKPSYLFDKYFAYYAFLVSDWYFNKTAVGTTVRNLNSERVATLPVPFPPLETQQRIVSRIESLFSKLDEASEKVQAVIDSHEARKQAILHKAFSGELTRDVEIKEDDSYKDIPEIPKEGQPYPLPEGWKWVKGKDIFSNGGNTSPKGDFFKYIDIESIDNTKQVVSYSKKIAVADAPSRAKRKLADGDTIFSMVRPYLRNIAYIDETLSSCIASTGFYVCRPNENINSRYLFFLMTSDYVVNGLNKFMRGDNSPSIKPEHIENYAFPLPHKNIQVYIVKIIESNIFCLNNFIELSLLAHEKINHIKKSILNKIFRGEFVT